MHQKTSSQWWIVLYSLGYISSHADTLNRKLLHTFLVNVIKLIISETIKFSTCFQEFMMATDMTASGSPEEKLRYVVRNENFGSEHIQAVQNLSQLWLFIFH